MPIILVTNDDGVGSKGVHLLAKALKSLGDVYVIAPETEQSAVGHALTLHRPLRSWKINNRTFFINGTPTDCIILGVNRLLPGKPCLVVSGINNGANMGDDVTYSGTVAAAIEGTLLGIPSIAVSLARDARDNGSSSRLIPGFEKAAQFTRKLAMKVLKKGLPQDTFLNVNVPDVSKIKGTELTKQGKRVYDNAIQDMQDPRGRRHYWIGGGVPAWETGGDTDFEAVQKGCISVTPIHLDFTNYKALEYMKKKWRI